MTTVQQGEIKGRATHLQSVRAPWKHDEWFTCQTCLKHEAELWAGVFLGEPLAIHLCQKCAAILENDLRLIESYTKRSLAYAKGQKPTDRDTDVTVEIYGGVAEVTEGPRFVNVKIIDHDDERE